MKLPKPQTQGKMSVEEALQQRRSVREYKDQPLTVEEIAQLLWAAGGFSRPGGYRTAPSAGALYPLEYAVVAGNVTGLPAAVYKYRPALHDLVKIKDGDLRRPLWAAALEQPAVRHAPAVIVISAVYRRTTGKYGERGIRYVHMEVGHASQNLALQAVALDLGTVVIGAFEDDRVHRLLGLPDDEKPLYLMPVGKP